jgi:ABC-type transporter Mla subunit MlaD
MITTDLMNTELKPATGEYTAERLRQLDNLSLDELADAINAALSAERETIKQCVDFLEARDEIIKQLRAQIEAAEADVQPLVDELAKTKRQLAAANKKIDELTNKS